MSTLAVLKHSSANMPFELVCRENQISINEFHCKTCRAVGLFSPGVLATVTFKTVAAFYHAERLRGTQESSRSQ